MTAQRTTYFRTLRWIFALVIFAYLWREGGYWRYLSYVGMAVAATVAILLGIASRSTRK